LGVTRPGRSWADAPSGADGGCSDILSHWGITAQRPPPPYLLFGLMLWPGGRCDGRDDPGMRNTVSHLLQHVHHQGGFCLAPMTAELFGGRGGRVCCICAADQMPGRLKGCGRVVVPCKENQISNRQATLAPPMRGASVRSRNLSAACCPPIPSGQTSRILPPAELVGSTGGYSGQRASWVTSPATRHA
jgi:hypothetical protein